MLKSGRSRRIQVSTSGAQAAAFFREIARTRTVWWVRDDDGSPTPVSSSGQPAFPYWSSKTRAQHAAQLWGHQFRAVPMPLDHWRSAALPDLAKDNFRVGMGLLHGLSSTGEMRTTDGGSKAGHCVIS
ncbi:DUF2750 domain-containing protein [Streptomyces sp. NPDC057486]|uniref:DUF2750 domain-containing protein n=1 Tax=Streptomyces sp. NPDC057486 TaxID=3346145 RepID=UPI0036C76B4F